MPMFYEDTLPGWRMQCKSPPVCTNLSRQSGIGFARSARPGKSCVSREVEGLRWPDSCESIRRSGDSRESFQGSRTEPPFCESRFRALKLANRRFEAIRVNRSNVLKIGAFLRIDSCEWPHCALRIARPSKWSAEIHGSCSFLENSDVAFVSVPPQKKVKFTVDRGPS